MSFEYEMYIELIAVSQTGFQEKNKSAIQC